MKRDKKVILVTGATSGLGLAMAKGLVAKGHTVYGTGRNTEEGPDRNGIFMLRMDVTEPDSVLRAIDRIINGSGHIDVLVNNAGSGICGAAELTDANTARLQMDTNFIGTATVCSAVLARMRPARSGLIVNIGSIAGISAVPYQGFYSASKAAVESYSQALAIETMRFGIKVCVIEPGDFRTSFTSSRKIDSVTRTDHDYSESFGRVLEHIEKDETSGKNPDDMGKLVCRIIVKRRPKFRYIIGSPLQKAFARASYILPGRIVQRLLGWFYSV